jgi:hypothetical protein
MQFHNVMVVKRNLARKIDQNFKQTLQSNAKNTDPRPQQYPIVFQRQKQKEQER